MAAARSLMQQGLRMCKADEDMWLQYYTLELLYALKLRVRRKVLGLDDLAAGERGKMRGVGQVAWKGVGSTWPWRTD